MLQFLFSKEIDNGLEKDTIQIEDEIDRIK